ncbi:MAG: hypothetical protein CL681_20505 [Blastopirellula sp.]|nr:hypothetical protein [Blastopirellula sp.]
MNAFFSTHYEQARERFRAAVEQANGQLTSYAVEVDAPDSGAALTMDVAILGDAHSRNAVVVSSGVHGVEGFFGSAIQTAWLQRHADTSAREDLCTILVHAVNPYGFAERRRWNEDNVDVNRNFLLPDESFQGEPDGYPLLDGFLNPPGPPPRLDLSLLQLLGLCLRHGYAPLAHAVTVGQYEHPQGLFFGGTSPTASQRIFQQHGDAWLGEAERIIHVDLHSGLGRFAQYQMLAPPTPVAEKWSDEVFGADNVQVVGRKKNVYRARGALTEWMTERLSQRTLLSVVAEFGTYRSLRVLNALRRENRAFHYSARDSAAYASAKAELLECFCPASTRWRRTVLDSGLHILQQAAAAVARISR